MYQFGENTIIYSNVNLDGYLINHLLPKATCILADFEDTAQAIMMRLPAECENFVFHINLSDSSSFPLDRPNLVDTFSARNIRVINAQLEDINRSSLHRDLEIMGLPCPRAKRTGSDEEPLFVKTNANWGGVAEARFYSKIGKPVPAGYPHPTISNQANYKRFHRCDVPSDYWKDARLVVESYISNVEESFFRVNVLLDAVVVTKSFSGDTIKNVAGGSADSNYITTRFRINEYDHPPEVPIKLLETLEIFFQKYEIDYGNIDIVHDGNDYYIIDINSTPWVGSIYPEELTRDFLRLGWMSDVIL